MNILIGITVLLVLMLSDTLPTTLGETTEAARLVGLLLLTVLPPFLAAVQTFYGRWKSDRARPYEQELAAVRLTAVAHAAVWFLASLATVYVVQWHEFVRGTCQLDRYVLLDEVAILAPVLLSLIASWAVFFDQHDWKSYEGKRIHARIEYVSLRCRVYLLIVLVPILLLILLKDLWPWLSVFSPVATGLVSVCLIGTLLCCMPLVVRLFWTNRAMAESEGRSELLQLCDDHKMSVKDIRVWETGNRVMNALVTGIVPRLRVLMVSDLLIKTFPTHELKAILRHEAGHIRLNHLPIRVGFIFLPALAMVALELDANNSLQQIYDGLMSVTGIHPSLLLGVIFIAYVLWVTAWLSKNMEFEADLYAVGAMGLGHNSQSKDCDPASISLAKDMADALLRFGEEFPDQFHKRSVTHPSLNDRIEMIRLAHSQPQAIEQFRRRFSAIQIVIASTIPVVTCALVLL